MKILNRMGAIVCAVLVSATCSHGRGTGALPDSLLYLGQPIPGRTPVVFAPGRISDAGSRLHGSPVFSPDQREVLWAVIPPAVLSLSQGEESWGEVDTLSIPGVGVQSPAFSSDGRRLYYQALGDGGEGGLDIWWRDLGEGGWGPPFNPGPPLNSQGLESQPSVTSDGTLYFTGTLEGSGLDRGIYRSLFRSGAYQAPELLAGGINSPYIDYCPWIAGDESYLLFASSRPGYEEVLHLHVSFKRANGSWSEPVSIHPALGFDAPARFPTVSPDGRFLFFLSQGRVYWVEMAPVLALREAADASSRSSGRKDRP